VKLQIHYSGQVPDDKRWAQGTGWLVEPDLLVTAGHCAFDHTYGFGKASSIKAYVGYSGRRSLQRPDVQFRNGTRALTPKGWADSDVNRHNDVAFIKLDKPFRDIRPFEIRATPSKGSEMIGVVGYPMDKSYDGERGGLMYEQFRKTDFDLNTSALNMLEHQISTFSGMFERQRPCRVSG
jgi:V8-like Glu-specific endopeptidase